MYKDVRKNVFVDGHKRSDVMEDRVNFLRRMEDLKRYIVKFDTDGAMKPKVYRSDCAVGGEDHRSIIVITHDECTFSANDRARKAWTREGNTFLRPKGRGQGRMVSEFILPFGRLNLTSSAPDKRQDVLDDLRRHVPTNKDEDRFWGLYVAHTCGTWIILRLVAPHWTSVVYLWLV